MTEDQAVGFLLLSSAHLAVVGGAALLLLWWLRLRGRWATWVCGLALTAPLLTLLAPAVPRALRLSVPPVVSAALSTEWLRPGPRPTGSPGPMPGQPASAITAAAVAPAAQSRVAEPRLSWVRVVLALWGIGGLVVVSRLWREADTLWRRLRTMRPVTTPRHVELLLASCDELGLRTPPRLLVAEDAAVPFVIGVWRPTVVMPAALLDAGDDSVVRCAMLHELVHVRRHHGAWLLPGLLIRVLYFFHPIAHLMLRRLADEREYDCDAEVSRVIGDRASYASFLLHEFEQVGGRRDGLWVLALGPSKVGQRVGRILEETNMRVDRTRSVLSLGTILALQAVLLSTTEAQSGSQAVQLDSINAEATDASGIYHVTPVFESLQRVAVITRGKPRARRPLSPGNAWSFDPGSGRLKLRAEVDDAAEMVVVSGVRSVPWSWRIRGELDAGSVRVLLGQQQGKRGVDFAVDAATNTVRFLRRELCTSDADYLIDYSLVADPARPTVRRSGAIGNHRDPAASRRFLTGETVATDTAAAVAKVGTNASATDDPRVWTLSRPMQSAGLEVAIVAHASPTMRRSLARGADYAYDAETGTIALLRDFAIDTKKQILFVHGTPTSRRVFLLHHALVEDSVRVIVGRMRLVEDIGFRVDLALGKITVLDAAIDAPGAKFFVSARHLGSNLSSSFGNYRDGALLRKLLGN